MFNYLWLRNVQKKPVNGPFNKYTSDILYSGQDTHFRAGLHCKNIQKLFRRNAW